jgi:hypothetical protein
MSEQLLYRNSTIQIVPDTNKKGKPVYWFVINGRAITFVSCPERAKRLAVNFIDVCKDEQFKDSKQVYYPHLQKGRLDA